LGKEKRKREIANNKKIKEINIKEKEERKNCKAVQEGVVSNLLILYYLHTRIVYTTIIQQA
jgi:hypothetical protein